MEDLKKIVSSFNLQNDLNERMWIGSDKTLNPQVRKVLLEVANEFIDSFDIEVLIDDVVITGSIANYNWSEYSDIDLHIIVDYGQFPKQMKDLYFQLFDLKKIVFNLKRNIKIFGFDVEVYVEDFDNKAFSDGVYSVLNDEWVSKPQKNKNMNLSLPEVVNKTKQWMRTIDGVLDNIQNEKPQVILDLVSKYKNKIKKYRTSGLEKGGEMSIENLVFKTLRRNGYLEKLYSIPKQIIDKKLSLDEKNNK